MDPQKNSLVAIKPSEIKDNPIEMFHKDWAVIAAGSPDDFNELTVSWGALGASWGQQKPIAIIFVSPNRYTHKYLESHDTFSINIFPQEFKKIEAYIGSHSGRDGDKVAATGLEVSFTDNGTPVFPQSRLILECKKIYSHDLDRSKFSDTLIETYNNRVFDGVQPHTIYYGEIIGCWEKK